MFLKRLERRKDGKRHTYWALVECLSNPMAQRGYSRNGRPDCVQVCIGLVVTEDVRLGSFAPGMIPWAPMALAGGRLFVRRETGISCYDLRAK